MKQYLDLVQRYGQRLSKETERNRKQSVFGHQMRFDLSEGFMVTTKLHFKSIVYELLWFLKEIQILNTFKENRVKIWMHGLIPMAIWDLFMVINGATGTVKK
jgi:thymidylate synthase